MLRNSVLGLIVASVIVASFTGAPVQPAAAGTVQASQLPGLLTEQADRNAGSYDRDLFNHWIDADSDGCDTRDEVLIEESTTSISVGASCTLSGGQWLSPFDDVSWTDPSDLDIDHMVPLAEAWRSGAWSWNATQRTQFANDLDVSYALIAVTDNVNASKSDRDPAQWMPPHEPYHCQYAIDWALVKYRWSLTADTSEMSALTSELSGSCGSTTVNLPTVIIGSSVPPGGGVSDFPSGTTRLAGASRYETAIKVSQRYASGVPAAFVATCTNFPDALSGAAAAALLGGPLLLTPSNTLDSAVASELRRLSPSVIYVLGGTGAVSSSVERSLKSVAPVVRFGGASRYDTGLAVVNGIFTTSTHAIIATGRNFPDALAATGAAGKLRAPVILVDGTQSRVPSAVLSSLRRMGVTTVAIAGGTGVVSSGIASQLSSAGYSVTRYGGADRYATTALINNAFFPANSSDTLFLATGANFPDALAGAALAGLISAPMYVTTASCVPASIYNSRNTLNAASTVVLGGTSVVSSSAAQNTKCSAPSAPPPSGTPSNPGDSKNCGDFSTWADAQAWFNRYYPYYGDIARLDADNDRIACESLPGAP